MIDDGTSYMTYRDNYACCALVDSGGNSAVSTFQVPDNFIGDGTLQAILSAHTAADAYLSIAAHYAAIGGTYTDNNDWADGVVTIGAIDTFLYSFDVAFTNLAIGDIVGIDVYRDPGNAGDTLVGNLYVMGYYFDYMADQ